MFKPIDNILVTSNSADSAEFLSQYNNKIIEDIKKSHNKLASKSFAPSSMKCQRLSWFRLRGTNPDIGFKPNVSADFQAQLGTLLHTYVQKVLIDIYDDDWIDVKDYVDQNCTYQFNISAMYKEDSLETLVCIDDYKIKFACDGIININNEFTLFELKTVDYEKFKKITQPLESHLDQIIAYCTFLELDRCMLMYLDRAYGDTKVFEVSVSDEDKEECLKDMDYVLDCVKDNLAPERLSWDSMECSYCKYKKTCKQYG